CGEQLHGAGSVHGELGRVVAVLVGEGLDGFQDDVLLLALGQVVTDHTDGAEDGHAFGVLTRGFTPPVAGLGAAEPARHRGAHGRVLLGEGRAGRAGAPEKQSVGLLLVQGGEDVTEVGGVLFVLVDRYQVDAVVVGEFVHGQVSGHGVGGGRVGDRDAGH